MSTTKEISIGDIAAQGAEASAKLDGDKMALNVGPSHPTTHGGQERKEVFIGAFHS